MKRFFVGLIFCTSALISFAQNDVEYGFFNHLGVNASVGTEGLSIGVATPLTNYLELSAGVNFMPGVTIKGDVNINAGSISLPSGRTNSIETYNFNKMQLEGDLARTTFDAKVNFYPAGNRAPFFIAAGLSWGGENVAKLNGHSDEAARIYADHPEYRGNVTINVNQYAMKVDREGNVSGDVRVKSLRPYLGLGYGRLIPKKRFGFRVELGCQFEDKAHIYQNDQEVTETVKENVDDNVSELIDNLTVYPVLKFTLTGRLF